MTPAELIASVGGSLRASFELDENGRTIGARNEGNRSYRCSACGEEGHSIERCNGKGQAPRPTYDQRRVSAKVERLNRAADRSLETARAEIARRIAAKAKP